MVASTDVMKEPSAVVWATGSRRRIFARDTPPRGTKCQTFQCNATSYRESAPPHDVVQILRRQLLMLQYALSDDPAVLNFDAPLQRWGASPHALDAGTN